jgi:hypothetical protein
MAEPVDYSRDRTRSAPLRRRQTSLNAGLEMPRPKT